jgi:hypothetical protein
MSVIDPSEFKSLKKHPDQPWYTFDPEEYMSHASMQAASESLCKSDSQWPEVHTFRVGKTPDGNTVFMMVLVNPQEGACWAGVICPEDKFEEMSAAVFGDAQPVLSNFLQDLHDKGTYKHLRDLPPDHSG